MAFVVTAVATAVELGTFAAIATAVSEVGIAMSVVGAVTGNKDLTKWGGYLGIAGGVGSLASSALSTTAGAAGEGLAAGETGAMDAGIGGSGVINEAALGSTVGDSSTALDSINTAAVDANGYTSTAGDGADQIAADKIDNPYLDQSGAQSSGAGQPAGSGQSGGSQPESGSFSDARFNTTNGIDPSWTGSGPAAPPPDLSSNGIAQWFKSLDPKMQSTVLQTASGAASGLFQGWSAEQKNALEREKFNLDKEKYSTALTNASAQPAVKFAPVGIINSQLKA